MSMDNPQDFKVTETAAGRVRPRVTSQTRVTPGPVQTLKVHPAVWRKAKQLAGGDPKRIKIVSETEVIIT